MYIYEPKFPDDFLDYEVDFTAWLAGDTIAGLPIFAVNQGSVVVSNILTANGIVVFWLAGGVSGENCVIDCEITTALGRVGNEQLQILIN